MSGLDPDGVTTPEEYVALLRRLKDSSGLTYRQLERRAEDLGEVLPKSTAASMLARDTLPRLLPRYALDRLEDGSYRVRADHPQFGPGCLGVRKASMAPGGTVVDDECGTGNAELFNVESFGTNGFQLRALHGNLCVGIAGGERDEWVGVRQVACDSPVSATILAFDPIPPFTP